MSKFLDLFQGRQSSSPPIWFMRQAGRSLPEYREVRKQYPNFLDLCYTPELTAQVTLQPVERFGLDAAILFSDILVVPQALGLELSFEEGAGPKLSPLFLSSLDGAVSDDGFSETLAPIYEAIRLIKEKRPFLPLIGFAGAPWTLALYMLEGQGSRDFANAKTQAFQNEERFEDLLEVLVFASALHLIEQVKAGADVVQLFDTWAGLCPATHFERWIVEPHRAIVRVLRREFPDLPIIGFPKGIGANLVIYAHEVGVSALSLDAGVPLPWVVEFPKKLIFQGNLDPLLLVAGGDSLKQAIQMIHEDMEGRPYIFNLGHGVLPQTPLQNIEDCVKWVRALA